MNIKNIFLLSLFFILISSADYQGHLQDINGEYFSGDFTFDESKIPLDTSKYKCNQMRNPDSLESMLIKKININLKFEYKNILHLKITDSNNPDRWEVPEDLVDKLYRFNLYKNIKTTPPEDSFYELKFANNSNYFSFSLNSKKDNEDIFYTFSSDIFLYTDRYINFESVLTTNDIYGFGERGHELKLDEGVYTIWPNDTGGIRIDDGKGGFNGYSHQPIGLHKTKYNNIWLGFIFLNSNNQDVVIKYNDDGTTSLQHKTIGGIIDYYIIIGQSPIEVVQNIQNILGKPFLPPYWAVASHQSRYGYNTLAKFNETYNNYIKYQIPLDTMWVDIDSYNEYQVFSVNQKTFAGLGDFILEIKEKHYHFVPIIDIGVGNSTGDEYAKLGRTLNCFIKSNYTKSDLFLDVWPGATLFPDYLNPNTTFFWEYGLLNYQKLVHYDGIWFDMNEIAGLKRDHKCVGEIADKCEKEDNFYYYKELPYLPGYNEETSRTNMAAGTINENGLLYGPDERKYAIYNTKPILSYTQNKITHNFLKNKLGVRPFIISRSATMGTGKYNGHWLGDNTSNYRMMKNSLDTIFNFGIFGMPMSGDDICGFFGEASGTLCNRWYNLGVFYPFSRNHNFNESPDQFPWSFNDQTVIDNIRNAVNYRYSLLRYIYSHLFMTSLNERVGFFNPVFFYFPNEAESYNKINEKAMIGDAFILFPLFTDDTADITASFPSGKWNQFPYGKVILEESNTNRDVSLSGKLDQIHLYMRGGTIVPWQETFNKYIQNSYYLRQERMNLIINPDKDNKAQGTIFFDNDEAYSLENGDYIRVNLAYENGVLNIDTYKKDSFSYNYYDNILGKIELFGTQNKENCNITFYSNEELIYHDNMELDTINDKFLFEFNSDKNVTIDEITKIEFNLID